MKKRLSLILVIIFLVIVLKTNIYEDVTNIIIKERYKLNDGRTGTTYTIEDYNYRIVINKVDEEKIYKGTFNKSTNMMKLEEVKEVSAKESNLKNNILDYYIPIKTIWNIKTEKNYKK
ncbi:hypothetical protein PV797_03960 [Clostridiaceae bacterium M8S5]|nr:hypothetical protein PV797_03960 [Clostridiaceae bacterium M8S5]